MHAVALQLDLHCILSDDDAVQGMMVVSLAELKKHTKMAGKKKLKHGNSPDGRLDLEMSWSSYLGLDDD